MRVLKWGAMIGGVSLVALFGHLAQLSYSGNFHAVVPGVLYRAAQVTPAEIAEHVKDQGIRSVLNLRGAAPGTGWYDDEIAASAANGVVHVDFRMVSTKFVDPERAEELIAVMKSLPTPILIHCENGANRSGLAAALYVAAIAGLGEEKAETQLSIRYGHFSVPYVSGTYAMDESWEEIEPVLGFDS